MAFEAWADFKGERSYTRRATARKPTSSSVRSRLGPLQTLSCLDFEQCLSSSAGIFWSSFLPAFAEARLETRASSFTVIQVLLEVGGCTQRGGLVVALPGRIVEVLFIELSRLRLDAGVHGCHHHLFIVCRLLAYASEQ